jgi:hypothetical protein
MKIAFKLSLFIFALFFSIPSTVFASNLFNSSLSYELRGYFLIQVDNHGQSWYVDLNNGLRYKLVKDSSAWQLVHDFGLGISHSNLEKIPVAVNERLIKNDSDQDGLDDSLEKAIGTDPFKSDSDGDLYSDDLEILKHFNPLGSGRLSIDSKLSSKLAGQILLDVERNGEAWYVSPKDNLRYYISDYQDLFQMISIVGYGINSTSLNYIADSASIENISDKSIKVDIGKNQRLYYFLSGVQIGSFPISSGKYSTPTPKGNFKIINKHRLAWSSYGLWMPFWLGLETGKFGFHELPIWPSGYREGANHLGVAVSHGCIRLGIGPAEFLYNWGEIGTPVNIY